VAELILGYFTILQGTRPFRHSSSTLARSFHHLATS